MASLFLSPSEKFLEENERLKKKKKVAMKALSTFSTYHLWKTNLKSKL